jgi:hypothetical protein
MIWFLIIIVVIQQFKIQNLKRLEKIWIDQYQRLLKDCNDMMRRK